MAVGGLHEISLLLGKLTGQTESLLNQTQILFDKLEDLQKTSALTLQALEGVKLRVETVEKELNDVVLPGIKDYKKIKQRGIGILGAAGLLGGGLTTVLPKLIKLVFGE